MIKIHDRLWYIVKQDTDGLAYMTHKQDDNMEFVVKMNTGMYEWHDKVLGVREEEGKVIVHRATLPGYSDQYITYLEEDIDKYMVREYDLDNWYPFGHR